MTSAAHFRRLNFTFVVAGKSQTFYVCIVCTLQRGQILGSILVNSLLDKLQSVPISISYKLPNTNRFQWVIFNELMRCMFKSNKETLLKQYTVDNNQLWQIVRADADTSKVLPNVFLGWLRFIVSLFTSRINRLSETINTQHTHTHTFVIYFTWMLWILRAITWSRAKRLFLTFILDFFELR